MNETTQPRATILVVDDNEDNRLIASTNLELAGYTVDDQRQDNVRYRIDPPIPAHCPPTTHHCKLTTDYRQLPPGAPP